MTSKLLTQFSRHQFNAGQWLEIGHETGITRHVFACNDNGFIYARTLNKLCLDFAKLNAESADLDLKVVAAQVLNIAIRQPAAEVAGFIHAGMRCS